MAEEKAALKGLFRDNPATPEGKYLVKRRDGTVPEWPSFVLGARDEDAADTLRFYALLKSGGTDAALASVVFAALVRAVLRGRVGEPEWTEAIKRWADKWDAYRAEHGAGDPEKGPHRKDDPATVAEMRKGYSA